MRKQFTPSEAARIVGVTVRLLEAWELRRVLIASIPARGRGALGRRYTFEDLVGLRTVRELRDAGLRLRELGKVAHALARMRPPQRLAESRLVVIGKKVLLDKPDGPIELHRVSPVIGARRKTATAESMAARIQTTVETRRTGMPSNDARSPFSADARTAMPMSVNRKKAASPAQMTAVTMAAAKKSPVKRRG